METTETAVLKLDENIVLQLGTKLYSQPAWWVLIRELTQNALDAGAKSIFIKTDYLSRLEFSDNGSGMTEKELLGVFLTVGGSDKRRDSSTIGGFGIAKLAIFSADDWEVTSSGKKLTKYILENHLPLESCDYHAGTRVVVEKANFLPGESDIKDFFKFVNRSDIYISINDSAVIREIPEEYNIEDWADSIPVLNKRAGFAYSATLVIRANGLPVFFDNIYNAPIMTIFYDVVTDLDPYDDQYPFTITRESFNPTSEDKKIYGKFCDALRAHFSKLQLLEKQKRANVIYIESLGIWTMGHPTSNQERLMQLVKKFKKEVEIICAASGGDYNFSDLEFGIIGLDLKRDGIDLGAHIDAEDNEREKCVLFINELVDDDDPLRIGISLHELVHTKYNDHWEGFANELTKLTILYLRFLKMAASINSPFPTSN